jgi:molybdopterin-containing oxidoreductase family membrane subunit
MMERRMNPYTPTAGMLAFIWRMALTTGTGSIFGFLVARQAYDSALLAPLFIALSLSYGLAVFLLVLVSSFSGSGRKLGDVLLAKFARLQLIFIAAGLYFVVVYHLTNLYFTKHHGFERFLLLEGGLYTGLFWLGQVLVGGILPMVLLASSKAIIGGQAFPLILFPGRQISSSFYDGVIHTYLPSLPELLLGVGGLAIVGIILMLALKLLKFLPERLDNEVMHAEAASHAVVGA